MKIKKGDTVLIISGKDRGRKNKVLEVLTKQGRIVVEGINLRKKHVSQKNQEKKDKL